MSQTNLRNKSGVFVSVAMLAVGIGIGACVTQSALHHPQSPPPPAVGSTSHDGVAFGTGAANAAPPYNPESEPAVVAVRKAAPAVVSIDTTARQQMVFDDPFDPFTERQGGSREIPVGAGSGVILEGGYILTNQHVVGEAVESQGSIRVTLADGRQFKAKAVGADRATDIALLQIMDAKNLPTIPLGAADTLTPGQTVIAIGNPVGLSASVTSGVVSALGRPMATEDRSYENLIQTDTAINPGNSGGALIDLAGRLVGINTLVRRDAQNIGFAIPIQTALRIADSLKKYGKVRRADPGIVPGDLNPIMAQRLNVSGVGVAGVYRGSPAASAGLQRNDVITAINGEAVDSAATYRKRLDALKIGQEVTLAIWRRGETASLKLKLAEAP